MERVEVGRLKEDGKKTLAASSRAYAGNRIKYLLYHCPKH